MRVLFWAACFAIFYTLVGYPLLAAMWARMAPRRWRRERMCPSVSVIIAAYNEAEFIGSKLDNTFALDYPRESMQVMVVADGSSDRTPEIVASYGGPPVTLVYEPERRGKTSALNHAIEHASGEIVVFSDANAFYRRDALRELVANFADPEVQVVTGAKLVVGEHAKFGRAEEFYWRYEGWIRANESLMGQATGVNGEMLAVRRAEWRPLDAKTICDDFGIAMMAMARGGRVVFEPRAQSLERPTARMCDELGRRKRMLSGRWQALSGLSRLLHPPRLVALWQIVSHKAMRALLPVFFAAAAIANLAVVAREREGALAALENAAFMGQAVVALLIIARLAAVPLPGLLGKLAAVATYTVLSQYAAAAGFARWLAGKHTPNWKKVARQAGTPDLSVPGSN